MEDKQLPKKDDETRTENPPEDSAEVDDKDLDTARGGLIWRSVNK